METYWPSYCSTVLWACAAAGASKTEFLLKIEC